MVHSDGLGACELGPHVMFNEAQWWCTGFMQQSAFYKLLFSAKLSPLALVIPNLHPAGSLAPSCTHKAA
jgi:hypothetical protein